MKKYLNLIGGGFTHAYSSSGWSKPEFLIWNKYPNTNSDISVHVDDAIFGIPIDNSKKNYAWIGESSAVVNNVIEWIKNNKKYVEENFIYLFTYDKTLLKITNNVKYVTPNWISWVEQSYWGGSITKPKLISMVASNKILTEGHKYRQRMIQKLSSLVDHYGWGFTQLPFEKKHIAYYDYMFSLVFENADYDGCITEKITDCLISKTIPVIFLGSKDSLIFNSDGFIYANEDFDISILTPELYQYKIKAIEENYEIAKKLITTEDYFYLNYIKIND